MKSELLDLIVVDEVYPPDEFGYVEAVFSAPAELVKDKYPEATSASIWLRFLPSAPKLFTDWSVSPIDEVGVHYDESDFDDEYHFDFDEKDLIVIAQKAVQQLNEYKQPYLLITVAEREIMTERFGTFEEARAQMLQELSDFGQVDDSVLVADEYDDGEFGYSKDSAYANDGVNHENYDWRIIKLFDI